MTAEQSPNISVIAPITPAIERVKVILFRPFDLKKWFVIGFCAWLAYLGRGGGGANFNLRGRYGIEDQPADFREALNQAKEYIANNLHWIIPVVVIAAAVGIALWVLFTWLSSRGQFMFLHCVAQNKAEVKGPWYKYRRHGNSLFAFRIVLGLIGLAVNGPLLVIIGFLVAAMISAGAPLAGHIFAVVITTLAVIVISIVLFLIQKFTMDFITAIMFLRTTSCRAAWREFLTLLSSNKGRLAVYILFQIVIAMAVGVIIITAFCLTCCIAGCILAIPYIGTVLLLPILVFTRAYSLFYLQQYGSQFDVFRPEVERAEAF